MTSLHTLSERKFIMKSFLLVSAYGIIYGAALTETAAVFVFVLFFWPTLIIRVNDALDFSKIEVGQLRVEAGPAFLREALMEVMMIMRSTYRSPRGEATADVRLCLEVAESVPAKQVLADIGRIRQVRARFAQTKKCARFWIQYVRTIEKILHSLFLKRPTVLNWIQCS